MNYLNNLKQEGKNDLYDYTKLLFGDEVPSFIEKYLSLPMFQTLKGKGQFCGVDNTLLYSPRCQYNRLDHSINCAGIIWRLTKNKKRTIIALCHDLSTVSFAHTIDFLLKDSLTQSSSEKIVNIKDLLKKSQEFKNYLKEDGLSIEDIIDPSLDSLVDNNRPKLCVDRLEGIIHTNFIWLNVCDINMVKQIIDDLNICINEYGEEEIGFNNIEVAKSFFEMMLTYAYVLQSKEDKYSMQFIADLLNIALKDKIISLESLYTIDENQIVELLKDKYPIWKIFTSINMVEGSNIKPQGYYVKVEAKKRYAIPLVQFANRSIRITDIDSKCNDKLQEFLRFKEEKYLFNDKIKVLVREDLC